MKKVYVLIQKEYELLANTGNGIQGIIKENFEGLYDSVEEAWEALEKLEFKEGMQVYEFSNGKYIEMKRPEPRDIREVKKEEREKHMVYGLTEEKKTIKIYFILKHNKDSFHYLPFFIFYGAFDSKVKAWEERDRMAMKLLNNRGGIEYYEFEKHAHVYEFLNGQYKQIERYTAEEYAREKHWNKNKEEENE